MTANHCADAPVRPDAAHPAPCRVWSPGGATGKQRHRCGWPAPVHVLAGCAHEHIWDGWLCGKHAASPSPCGACFVLDGHICPMVATVIGDTA